MHVIGIACKWLPVCDFGFLISQTKHAENDFSRTVAGLLQLCSYSLKVPALNDYITTLQLSISTPSILGHFGLWTPTKGRFLHSWYLIVLLTPYG